jgi:hypothetical protein
MMKMKSNAKKFEPKSVLRQKLNIMELFRQGQYGELLALLHDSFDSIAYVDDLQKAASPEGINAALFREACEKALELESDFGILYLILGSLVYQIDYGNIRAALDVMNRVLTVTPKIEMDYQGFIDAWRFAMRSDDQALGIVSNYRMTEERERQLDEMGNRIGEYYYHEAMESEGGARFDSLLLAADMDHPEAQFALGNMFKNGEAVPADSERAAEWYQKAADRGSEKARLELLDIKKVKRSKGRKEPVNRGYF